MIKDLNDKRQKKRAQISPRNTRRTFVDPLKERKKERGKGPAPSTRIRSRVFVDPLKERQKEGGKGPAPSTPIREAIEGASASQTGIRSRSNSGSADAVKAILAKAATKAAPASELDEMTEEMHRIYANGGFMSVLMPRSALPTPARAAVCACITAGAVAGCGLWATGTAALHRCMCRCSCLMAMTLAKRYAPRHPMFCCCPSLSPPALAATTAN